jgi:hypothetical protein
MNKEQVEIMIESLEELNEELSIQSKGSLCFEQWELLDHLKQVKKGMQNTCIGFDSLKDTTTGN